MPVIAKINQLTLLTVCTCLLILSAGVLPVEGRWIEEFDNSDLPDWQLGAVDWSQSTDDETVVAIDDPFLVADGQLQSITDGFRDAHSHACSLIDEDLSKISLRLLTSGSPWGIYVGNNFNLFSNMSIDDITFRGYFILFSLQITTTRGGMHLLDFITNELTDSPLSLFQSPDFDSEGRISPFLRNVQDVWIDLSVDFSSDQLDFEYDSSKETHQFSTQYDASQLDSFDTICLTNFYRGTVLWEYVAINDRNRLVSILLSPIFWAVLVGGAGAGGFVYYRRLRRRRLARLHSRYSDIVVQKHSGRFEMTDDVILSLLNVKPRKDKNYNKELKNSIPLDLFQYKYLLHPTRLMMLKILHDEYKMDTADMRDVLDITSGEFSSHSRSLHEKGYIELENSFSLTLRRTKTVYLTERGRKEYREVIELLNELIYEPTPYAFVLQNDQQDNLYPERK